MDKSEQLLERPANTGGNDHAFVARQPIYTRTSGLFAYELLYQNDIVNVDPDLESLVGDTLAFIRVSPQFILEDCCTGFPRGKVVFEISREVKPEAAVMRSLIALRQAGYSLALGDFDYTEQTSPILELANYVSLNFGKLSAEEVSQQLELLSKSKAKLIARKVGSHEEFDVARGMGFEYFTGSCFNTPKVATPTRVPLNRLSTLQLVLKLQETELSPVELEKIVAQDLAISFKLLRFVNSASLSLSRTVESIRHAIQMVGTERIRLWASMLLMTKLDDKPELNVTALVRARMAERLAVAMGVPNSDSYFLVGLFSLVDALLNVPMAEAIQLLPFSKQIREGLLNHEGSMGSVLLCVLAYESGNWDEARCGSLEPAAIRQCYLDAIAAARKMPK
jgi:EAL and modified HD-GYP domain-containing signal transduction protein